MIKIWYKLFPSGNDNFMVEDLASGLRHVYTTNFDFWLIYEDNSTTPDQLGYEYIGEF